MKGTNHQDCGTHAKGGVSVRQPYWEGMQDRMHLSTPHGICARNACGCVRAEWYVWTCVSTALGEGLAQLAHPARAVLKVVWSPYITKNRKNSLDRTRRFDFEVMGSIPTHYRHGFSLMS